MLRPRKGDLNGFGGRGLGGFEPHRTALQDRMEGQLEKRQTRSRCTGSLLWVAGWGRGLGTG